MSLSTLDERFARLLQAATDDPEVIGLALTGSRGKGFNNAYSDYDVLILLREDASPERYRWYRSQEESEIELQITTPGDLARHVASWGNDFAWSIIWNDRYSYANAAVLLDKTGQLQRLLDPKGIIPTDLRFPLLRESLDGYVNSLYRSLKCLRNGNRLGAHLEAADSIGYALTFIFALERRHRPYFGYLERELNARPLASFSVPGDELLAMIAAITERGDAGPQQQLFAVIEPIAIEVGCADVLASWGYKYEWIKGFQADKST
jgi:predicted nucleotidyltransferase